MNIETIVKGPIMITTFPPQWQEKLDQVAFTHLTPIQEQAFQPIFDGKNLLGVSPTGTGKTLAYLFPTLLTLTLKNHNNFLS